MSSIARLLSLLSIGVLTVQAMENNQQKFKPYIEYKDDEKVRGRSVGYLRNVWKNSDDIEMKEIEDIIKDPDYVVWEEDRFRVLYGDPGAGKTTLSLALGVALGWKVRYRVPGNYQTEKRNEAAKLFIDEAKLIMKSQIPTVFILDEFNGMVDYPEETSNDNAATAKAIWPFLDKLPAYKNLFTLMICNDIAKIPDQIKSRSVPNFIWFRATTDPNEKLKMFLEEVSNGRVEIAKDFSFLKGADSFFNNGKGAVRRDMRSLAIQVQRRARRDDKKAKVPVVHTKHVLDAIAYVTNVEKEVHLGEKRENEREQRERHFQKGREQHEESIQLQKDHHKASLQQQKEQHEESIKQQKNQHHESVEQNWKLHADTKAQHMIETIHKGNINENSVADSLLSMPKEARKYFFMTFSFGAWQAIKQSWKTWKWTREEVWTVKGSDYEK